MQLCGVCSKKASTYCSRCQNIYYCSRECQAQHWKEHKLQCVQDMEDLMRVKGIVNNLAKFQHQCHCDKCVRMCHSIPAAYSPIQVEALAKKYPNFYQDMCVQDYFSYPNANKNSFYLRPPTMLEKKGERALFLQKRAQCAFLGPQGCTLKMQDVPLGCLVASNCKEGHPQFDKKDTPPVWNSVVGLRVMRAFEAHNKKRNPSLFFGEEMWMEQAQMEMQNPVDVANFCTSVFDKSSANEQE